MKVVKRIVGMSLACALMATTAFAGAPVHGVYKTITGDLDSGRYGESFAAAGEFFTVGNVYGAASWDGATLGAQWSWSCCRVQTSNQTLVSPNEDKWAIIYDVSSATFFLNGTGEAWDGGDVSYSGTVDEMTDEYVVNKFFGTVVGINSSPDWSGHFDAPYDDTCVIVTHNTAYFDDDVHPGDYPAFTESDCSTARTFGQWGSVTAITIQITSCLVATEDATWGAIKSLYNSGN
jgi:hypothetical protein